MFGNCGKWYLRCLLDFPSTILYTHSVPQCMGTFSGQMSERRRRPRINVQWPLWILVTGNHEICTRTINLSSDGFFFYSPETLNPGEPLIAILDFPCGKGSNQGAVLRFRCEARVVHVQSYPDSKMYGVGCRILEYSILRPVAEERIC